MRSRTGACSARTSSERELLELIGDEPATLLVGVVGGQGALLGRGNQQLSPAVLRRIGTENIEIVAGSATSCWRSIRRWLHVDTGDPELDRAARGYRRVHVAPETHTRLQGRQHERPAAH